MHCFFVSDLHGRLDKYEKLFNVIQSQNPDVVFLGGDLLPHYFGSSHFVYDFLIPKFNSLKEILTDKYPEIFVILGNDDARIEERSIINAEQSGLIRYIHSKNVKLSGHDLFGYSFTPPSPFQLKDWEKYDISQYIDPGCISPEEGKRTIEISEEGKKLSTIKEDLEILTNGVDLTNAIFLFHGPPYKTNLDRAALDGKMIDHVPLDVHVGSIAIKNFIEEKQPMLTLHGHIHESPRIMNSWNDKIGRTYCFSAAHDGKELAIIKFDLETLEKAERELI